MKGIELKEFRKKLKLNQEEFGRKLFVSKRTIINYEQSEEIPPEKVQLIKSLFPNEIDDTQLKTLSNNDNREDIDKNLLTIIEKQKELIEKNAKDIQTLNKELFELMKDNNELNRMVAKLFEFKSQMEARKSAS